MFSQPGNFPVGQRVRHVTDEVATVVAREPGGRSGDPRAANTPARCDPISIKARCLDDEPLRSPLVR